MSTMNTHGKPANGTPWGSITWPWLVAKNVAKPAAGTAKSRGKRAK
jgi:hypothetical protein